ncbi:hypothetical protein PIB30_096913 [Stylosanthes scabra]|uniref:Uncharacterized protein n=1 Tax=Stylosanthes scabra TaxID=79078 RepID=A0ABU6QX02_9FABA|nr:hypothetical protein [Stylosanthes scabra]
MEEVKAIKAKQEELWNNTNRFHSQIKKEQDMLAREIQEIRKGQINQTLMNSQRSDAEKNMEQAVERQDRELVEMKKQLNLWTRNASAREAYSCWAHQQANPNLSEIPINHIPDLMQTNAKKGRHVFYGALKSHELELENKKESCKGTQIGYVCELRTFLSTKSVTRACNQI